MELFVILLKLFLGMGVNMVGVNTTWLRLQPHYTTTHRRVAEVSKQESKPGQSVIIFWKPADAPACYDQSTAANAELAAVRNY